MAQSAQYAATHATIIVPAHNESTRITDTARCLLQAIDNLQTDGRCPALGLFFVCNACSDDTASLATRAAPTATLIETPARGKAKAINLALTVAPPGSVIIVDADVAPDQHTLGALLEALAEPGVLAASPAATFVRKGVPSLIRAYYRVFARHPYLSEGIGGAGIYGLSPQGRRQLGAFPEIAADDQYVRQLFPLSAQRRISRDRIGRPVSVTIAPPPTLASLVRTEIRARNGDRVVAEMLRPAPCRQRRWRMAAFRAAPLDFVIFLTIKLLARLLMPLSRSGRTDGWAPARPRN